jgi:hypothetical protein
MSVNALARLEHHVKGLGECRSLKDFKKLHSMAVAAEQYAKAEKLGDEAVRYAMEIKIKAAREAGLLLATAAKNAGSLRRGTEKEPRDETPTLSSLGITKKESSRWQQLASLPEPVFEKLLKGEKPTESRLASVARPIPARGYDSKSLERRGAFARLCRDLVALGEPETVAAELAEFDKGDLLDEARCAGEWLATVLKTWTKEIA